MAPGRLEKAAKNGGGRKRATTRVPTTYLPSRFIAFACAPAEEMTSASTTAASKPSPEFAPVTSARWPVSLMASIVA